MFKSLLWLVCFGRGSGTCKISVEKRARWMERCPDTPIMFTEYGADTVPTMFTEEYQVAYYEANHEVI